MNRVNKLFFVFSLLALLSLTLTTSASAFDGRFRHMCWLARSNCAVRWEAV
jgi:hypothetical protein